MKLRLEDEACNWSKAKNESCDASFECKLGLDHRVHLLIGLGHIQHAKEDCGQRIETRLYSFI